jgi:hypothetical protein
VLHSRIEVRPRTTTNLRNAFQSDTQTPDAGVPNTNDASQSFNSLRIFHRNNIRKAFHPTKDTTSTMINMNSDQLQEPRSRAALRLARRVVIKAGTSVVANADGSPSLRRLGAIVEQIAELNHAGVEVLFVSSGAVGMGRNLLRKQARLNMSFMDLHKTDGLPQADEVSSRLTQSSSINDLLEVNEQMESSAAKSYAAAGQFELMNLYQSLFAPKNVTASQMLVRELKETILCHSRLNIVTHFYLFSLTAYTSRL